MTPAPSAHGPVGAVQAVPTSTASHSKWRSSEGTPAVSRATAVADVARPRCLRAEARAPRDRRYTWAWLFGAVCPERRTGAAVVPDRWAINPTAPAPGP